MANGDEPKLADVLAVLIESKLKEGQETKGPPPGWSTTQKGAVAEAKVAYNFEGDPAPGEQYPFDIIRSGLYFTYVDKKVEAASDKRYSVMVSPINGNTYAVDMANPTKELTEDDIIFKAANKAPEGAVPIGDTPIDLGDGRKMQPYAITDANGVTTRYNVILEGDKAAPTAADIVTFTDAEGGGRLIPLGDGRYTYEAPPDAPFTTGPDDVVPLPKQGGSLIKTSKNQYQFVRDTYEPGVKIDPQTGRQFVQSASGNWTELDPRYQQGVVESGGRQFLQQTTGALAELAPRFDPGIQEVDGMTLLQQRSGAISQLAKPNLDQIITQALVDGEYDKAFAFQDFRDRPSAAETFQTALEFARSPADQILISSIARGEQTVQPPPPGTIQRVGPQADFLVQAYQDFQRRTQAGRAPTEEEATTLSARAAAGQTPLTDTLQARLETMTRDMERKDEEHAVKMQGLIQKQSEEAQLFQTKLNTALGLNADGTPKVSTAPITSTSTSTSTPAPDTVSTDPLTGAQVTDASARDRMREFQSGEYDGNWENWAEAQGFFQRSGGMSSPLSRGDAANIAAGMMRDKGITDPLLIQAEIERFANSNLAIMQGTASANQQPPDDPPETPAPAAVAPTSTAAAQPQLSLFDERAPVRSEITKDIGQSLYEQLRTEGVGKSGGFGDFYDTTAKIGDIEPPFEITTDTPKGGLAGYGAISGSPITFADIERQIYKDDPSQWTTPASALSTFMGRVKDDEPGQKGFRLRAGGGTVQPGEITVVGEQGPEIAMMPPGTHILPLGRATKQDIKAAQATGRAYQQGGIVFGELPFGIRQLQAGRPITPSRGYLSQAAGLTLPSAQALSNLTPESRDVYFDLARQAGIPSRAFGQELQAAMPSGRRLPTSRMLPFSSRGVR